MSTAEQHDQGLSLDTQLATLVQNALAKGHSPPFCFFCDAGISAGSVTKRPAMTLLMEEVRAKRITHVLATKLDRLWRNTHDALTHLQEIRTVGASLTVLDLNVDFSSPLGEVMFTLLGAFAQFERKQDGERVRAVNRNIAASGRWIGSTAPFGYTYDPIGRRLLPDPETADRVREMFRRYVEEGWGRQRIARWLQAEGVPPPREDAWQEGTVAYILRNPIYAGRVVYGRSPAGMHRNHPERGDWQGAVQATGTHEPLIALETYQAAMDRDRQTPPGRPPSPRHLLSGLLVCATCGSRLYARVVTRERRAYYVCGQRARKNPAGCPDAPWVRCGPLEEAVLTVVEENIRRAKPGPMPARPRKVATQGTERKRAYWERYRDRAVQLYQDGEYARERYLHEVEKAEREIARLERPAEPRPLPPEALTLRALLEDPDGTVEEKQRLLALFVERIVVGRETVAIHFHPFAAVGWRPIEEFARCP